MKPNQPYAQASLATADNLKTIAQSLMLQELSHLSLPEIEQAADLVAQMVPAGNVPGVILNGLARLSARRPLKQNIRRDINLLFQGVEQVLDHAAYGAFFAGPAAVIWGYQNLLKLAGKKPEDAFPQGTWQFYVDYALREDTARHTNETHGFDTVLAAHGIQLAQVDRMTALVMTCMHILIDYPALLANEWRERVCCALVPQATQNRINNPYSQWEKQRPYTRRADAGQLSYSQYRRAKFDEFLQPVLAQLSDAERAAWQAALHEQESSALPDYQQQMSILGYLKPEANNEEHITLAREQVHIGVIANGAYFLLPVWNAQTNAVWDVLSVRAQIAQILHADNAYSPAELIPLAQTKRAALGALERQLNPTAQAAWAALRTAPILINCDMQARQRPLAQIRQAERGIGDHALTIFNTDKTLIFDQSHIYFDGGWGAALAEIITNESLSWARYLASLSPARAGQLAPRHVDFGWQPREREQVRGAPKITTERSAETDGINLKAILGLRKLFKQRSDLLNLTVNDLLILYRAIHAMTYRPSPMLNEEINALRQRFPLLESIYTQDNPAILVPIDASRTHPAERLQPMSFEVPLNELNLIALHTQTLQALSAYKHDYGERDTQYATFDTLQREYLATLAGFGAVLTHAKDIASAGEGTSSGSIRLLAHMPRALQRLLDEIPSKVDVLNDIIKGREVFSNVGAVASSSTLTRFITAKDDNEKKTLAWGVITDAQGVMRISLRDFRPHVAQLQQGGYNDLAQRITQDYLETYVQGLNTYIADLRRITVASRETRMIKDFRYDE